MKQTMDLSNLSSDLPPTKPIDQTSINDLNRELTTEFKNAAKSVAALYNSSIQGSSAVDAKEQKIEFANAAKSVAALYRLSNNSNSLLLNKGYLECLDDLLENITHGEDLENWALTKRAEITNITKTTPADSTAPEPATSHIPDQPVPLSQQPENFHNFPEYQSENFHIPTDYDFALRSDFSSGYRFRPGFPPLSVTHGHKFKHNAIKFRKNDSLMRRKLRLQHERIHPQSSEESTASSDYETDRDSDDITAPPPSTSAADDNTKLFDSVASTKQNKKSSDDGTSAKKKRKLTSGGYAKIPSTTDPSDSDHHNVDNSNNAV